MILHASSAKRCHPKAAQSAEAHAVSKDAAAALAKQTTIFEEAEKQAGTWIANHDQAEGQLKLARAAAAATTASRRSPKRSNHPVGHWIT